MTQTVDFTVTGEQTIHCNACEQRITKALHRLPGIQDVQASSQTQHVVVTLNPERASAQEVRAKLEQMGYHIAPQEESR